MSAGSDSAVAGKAAVAPVLVLAYGNPSRGDDALAPRLLERLEKKQADAAALNHVELLTDFQLQVEHAIDLQQRKCVLFVDASVSAGAPFEFCPLQAERDDSYSSHAMSPQAVLAVYREINRLEPPPSYLLAIRGYRFELGEGLSEQAEKNLAQAESFVSDWLRHGGQVAEQKAGIRVTT
ncbi:MAG TPA: hydrogenase maturation protease [Thiotrichales bacterium]|nr:hydrogenase maturation protease [Thiotrichales bacterium]